MINPADWKRIEALLNELLELSPEDRASRLDQLSGEDATLRPQIERLLDADSKPDDGILDRGLATYAARVMEAGPESSVAQGELIGPYRVVRELGRGGMGEVLLAERVDSDFEQFVALKIIREGMNRREIVERFRRERRILARLRHPNIAALYDGGTTADDVPYFAMEYVEGEHVTDWCDERQLSVDDRVELFESICHAVQYAHRNLVVHRDLKPSNVLVTADGVVKLLDFGIAKLVDTESDHAEKAQHTGAFLTPAYAAPEQLLGEPTSAATDVYSLGVLLYVLLTGHNPHGDISRTFDVAQAIVREDAPNPSAMVGRGNLAETGAEIARRRATEPAALRRRLRGDLDNILRKALSKAPDMRYGSVENLRMDLERYRGSLPISASPATAKYRLRRFVRRHTVPVAAGVTLLISVLGFAVWMSVLYTRAIRAEVVSEREAEKATRVAEFLEELFEVPDPIVSSGEVVTARELLDAGAERIERELSEEPDVRASLQLTMGRTYRSLGLLDSAEGLEQSALRSGEALHGTESEEVASALVELAMTQHEQGHLEEGEQLARRALEIRIRLLSPDHPDVASTHAVLGALLMAQSRFDEAEQSLREALEIRERAPAQEGQDLGIAANDLADAYLMLGRAREAAELFEQAIEAYRLAGAANHPYTSYFYGNLGHAYMVDGRYEDAEAALLKGLEIRTQTYGVEHTDVGRLHVTIGELFLRMDRQADAERHLYLAVATLRKSLPPEHPELAWSLDSLGSALLRANKPTEAEPVFEEALEIAEASVDSDNVYYGVLLDHVADLRELQEGWEEAGELRERVVAIYESAFGPDHPYLASRLGGLARNREHLGRLEEARGHYQRIVGILEAADGASEETLDAAREALAELDTRLAR